MHLFLTGFMGAGKTTVGLALANSLERPFFDLDAMIEAEQAMTITELFDQLGERGFRILESAVLQSFEDARPAVVAMGGGVLTVAENRAWMKTNGISIWLDVPFDVLIARLDDDELQRRPLFQSESQARSLFERRREEYGDADLRIEVLSSHSAAEVAAAICDKLEERSCDI